MPTQIQEIIIPILLKKDVDIIGQAQTGTGKTAAFGLPLIERLKEGEKHVQALIMVPTRELALQVSEEINSLKGEKRLRISAVYGGQSIEEQLRRLRSGIDIVVGTPGRIIDHLHRGSLKLNRLSYLVLDEADEMLDMGFIEDIEEILTHVNQDKRMMLFGATMPDRILGLVKKFMKKYERFVIKKDQLTTNLVDQIYFEVSNSGKFETLCRIVDIEESFYGLVFCRTKADVDDIAHKLLERGYSAEALHGDISQSQRERILGKFKSRKINVLVATDVAARGIDIENLTHVINYSLPQNPDSYVHRIGRTGRAGKEGTAITFVTPQEYRNLLFIKRHAKAEIRKEKVPGIKEVLDIKKKRIKKNLKEIIESGEHQAYKSLAEDILGDSEPADVLSAMIKLSFQDELDEKKYAQVRESSVDRSGTTRLFVSLGRTDGLTPRKLIDFIRNTVHIKSENINDIEIFDRFSFVTLPFEEAEIVINKSREMTRGRKPVVSRARKKEN